MELSRFTGSNKSVSGMPEVLIKLHVVRSGRTMQKTNVKGDVARTDPSLACQFEVACVRAQGTREDFSNANQHDRGHILLKQELTGTHKAKKSHEQHQRAFCTRGYHSVRQEI